MPTKRKYVLNKDNEVIRHDEQHEQEGVIFSLYDTFVPLSDGKRLFIYDEKLVAPYGVISLVDKKREDISTNVVQFEEKLRNAAYDIELRRIMSTLDKIFEMRDNGAPVRKCLNEFFGNVNYNSLFNRTKAEITRVLLESLLDDEDEELD